MNKDKYTTIKIPNEFADRLDIFGSNDKYINIIQDSLDVIITFRNGDIKISAEDSKNANYAKELFDALLKEETISEQQLNYLIGLIKEGNKKHKSSYNNIIGYTFTGKPIKTKTIGQNAYINSIKNHDITFAIGPAGTGKTYLAVAMAVWALKNNDVSRIVLTRPAVEAGESLGFLPGDLKEKIDPYLKPLYDALFDIMGTEQYERQNYKGNIEIAPLAYMRGRTLNNSFIILDEAQNTTREQMKMFLTRLGENSKAIVTGDVTQIDLPSGKKSGLIYSEKILKDVKGLDFVHLTNKDVVRNPLVQRIIEAYEKFEK